MAIRALDPATAWQLQWSTAEFKFPNAGRYGIDGRRHMICMRLIKNVGSGVEERHRRFGPMMPPGPGWAKPGWTGLDWTGLDWTGLDWTGLAACDYWRPVAAGPQEGLRSRLLRA